MEVKYKKSQVILHWISAVVIIWGTLSGFYVALFDAAAQHKEWVSFLNVSLTTLFIPVFILRIGCALRYGKPKCSPLTDWQERIAKKAHLLIYCNITLVMITGVLMMERDINVFNMISFAQPLQDPLLTHFFNQAHKISCATLGVLIVGHILAVIKHHRKGHNLLNRMTL
ncbi:cytochrome b561 [Pantoea alhagi]|uniref:cytochrome b n=1 Tax=Mixta sp. BE291 TaxID=3158787 RepID=UPI00285A0561|nr:cytochrome b561 [Pantoea alhagi]